MPVTSPPPDGSVSPPIVPQPRLSRSGAVFAVLVIAAIVVAAAVVSYVIVVRPPASLAQVPAHLTAYLSNGTTLLDVPLMTLYTAPAFQNHGFATNVSFSVSSAFGGPSSTYTFRWGGVSGTSEAVRFVLTPTVGYSMATAFQRGPDNGFLALPAGNCTQPGESQRWASEDPTVGDQTVTHELWRMNYSVVRMAATVDGVDASWIQVNYSLVRLVGFQGDVLPAANVSLPSAADLSPVMYTSTYNLTKGQTLGALIEVHSIALPLAPFRHPLPPVTLDAGAVGNLTVILTSEFRWSAADSLWLGWSITAAHDGPLTANYSIDQRFGSPVVALA